LNAAGWASTLAAAMLGTVRAVGLLAALLSAACSSNGAPTAAQDTVPAFASWRSAFAAQALELSAAPDHSVVVRLAESPWLVRHDVHGRPSALHVDSSLAWAAGFVSDADGSLYVAGSAPPSEQNASLGVRVDHLSPTGGALTSTTWTLPESPGEGDASTRFEAISLGADGRVYVLATNDSERALVALSADGEPDVVTPVSIPLGRDAAYFDAAQRLAVAADGSALIQGGASVSWLLRADASSAELAPWSYELANAESAVAAGGVLSAPGGGWFAAVGSGSTDDTGHGFYHRGLLRISGDGRRLWGGGDYFEPGVLEDTALLRHVSLAELEDSVLLAVARASDTPRNADDVTLSPDQPQATLVRYSLKGDYEQAWDLGGVQATIALEARAAVFLLTDPEDPHRYSIERIDFAALAVPGAAAGEACSVNEDCLGGSCCASSSGLFAVTCSANLGCPVGTFCSDDSQCQGTCSISPGGAGQGFCTGPCAASLDCPSGYACIHEQCLRACLGTDDCPYRGTECSEANSAEALQVSVCTAAAL
jgi:hypothetical protein